MPSYAYQCISCGHEFTKSRPMKDSAKPETCPECDYPADRKFVAPPMVRVYGGTPIHHKRS